MPFKFGKKKSTEMGCSASKVDAHDAEVADKVPGGFIVKGATGATSSVLHGTVKGAGAAVGGVAGAGKAVTKGVTSGSVSGIAAGMKEAGGELAGGVKGAGSGVAGGVTNAGSAAKRGSVKE